MPETKTPIGFRCNFCVEVHPTLRAICNHLRKHVQYGEVKEGHVKVNQGCVPERFSRPVPSVDFVRMANAQIGILKTLGSGDRQVDPRFEVFGSWLQTCLTVAFLLD